MNYNIHQEHYDCPNTNSNINDYPTSGNPFSEIYYPINPFSGIYYPINPFSGIYYPINPFSDIVYHKNYLSDYDVLNNYEIDSTIIQKILDILSLSGEAFERILRQIFNFKPEPLFTTENFCIEYSKNKFMWKQINETEIIYGYEIFSLFSLINNISIQDSICYIHRHLAENEKENSFSNPNYKAHWRHINNPLYSINFPEHFLTLISCFKSTEDDELNELNVPIIKNITLNLPNGENFSFSLSLMRHLKTLELQWVPKNRSQTCDSIESFNDSKSDTNSNKLSNLITPAGTSITKGSLPPKDIIPGLIQAGNEIWIYGPEKSYKSWISRHLAHTLSTGGTLLNKYKVCKHNKVLYIDGELPAHKFEQFCKMEAKGQGQEDIVGPPFDYSLAHNPRNETGQINILNESCQNELEKNFHQYDVIILDCYYALTENKASTKEFRKFLTKWKNKGKTFIIIDHANRDGELQGSIDKRRSADLCIELTKSDNDTLNLSFPIARYLKQEDCEPLQLKVNFVEDAFFFSLYEADIIPQEVDIPTKRIMLIYILKNKHSLSLTKEIPEIMGYGKSTVYTLSKKTPKEWPPHQRGQYQNYCEMSLEELEIEAQKLKDMK